MITILVVVAAALLLTARRRHRRSAGTPPRRGRSVLLVAAIVGLYTLIGTPATAQPADTSCAPFPERPGTGMVGALDPAEGHGGRGGPYTDEKHPNSPYRDYGFAGMVWHVYDPDCEQALSVTNPSTTIDTWAGNQLFNIAKNLVGVTNSLHYTLANGGVLGGLNDEIGKAANAVFDNVYMQLFSVLMLVLAVLMFRQIWRGDLATVSKRGLFALGGMWLAASTFVLVSNYTAIDNFIVDTTNGLTNGLSSPDDKTYQQQDVLPTELHNRIVYENWLRGEFGKPDGTQAEKYGRPLLDAQAWTWDDVRDGSDARDDLEQGKRADYQRIYNELGAAQGYFTGTEGSRTGAGFLAFFQSIVYSLFQFLAQLAVLLAQLLLRVLTLAAPVIGLVALVHHDILRRVGRAVGAVVLNVLVLAVLAGIHFRFLQMIFGEGANLSMLTQMLLAGIVTLVFLLVGRPLRRIWQMVDLSVGATGASLSSRGGIFSRFRKRKDAAAGRGPQDEFWDQVRDDEVAGGVTGDAVTTANRGRRPRPEATGPITATAQRLDQRRQALASGGPLGLPSGRRAELDPARPPTSPAGRGGPATAVPSRVVDTAPVADRSWDWDRGEWGEDAVVVPSRVHHAHHGEGGHSGDHRYEAAPAAPRPAPRPADVEMVAGRPVHVVYRPSRGLEVREPVPRRTPRQTPLRDGPRDTDAVVR